MRQRQQNSHPATAPSGDHPSGGNKRAASAAGKIREAIASIEKKKFSEMTPKERMYAVADILELSQPLKAKDRYIGFNMNYWVYKTQDEQDEVVDKTRHGCGTVGCIAGWTTLISKLEKTDGFLSPEDYEGNHSYSTAMHLFGLSDSVADSLFHPYPLAGDWDNITPKHAAAVLRHCANTGTVNWLGFDNEGKPVK